RRRHLPDAAYPPAVDDHRRATLKTRTSAERAALYNTIAEQDPVAAHAPPARSSTPMSDRRIPRLFLERDLGSDRAPLTDREAKYLGKVLRLKRGDLVLAFNGRGQERYAAIASLARSGAGLALAEHVD